MFLQKIPLWFGLFVSLGTFTALRLPTILHQPGGQDEQFFAVPGYTVWKEGIPRIPFFPARERASLFERSDRCLLAMPPALFYCQAPFHAFFPPGYPTARLPLYFAGLTAIALTYFIAISLHASPHWALMASFLLAISRPLMFTGTIARPDLPCVVCGLGAILVWLRTRTERRWFHWLAIGGLCGLACLFHPFGLVFCIQAGLAAVLSNGTARARIVRVTLLGAAVGFTLSLWLPLIIRFPEEFRTQFFANIFDRAGPGLPWRLAWPFPSLLHHSRLIWEFVGPSQCLLYGVIVVIGCIAVRLRTFPRDNGTPSISDTSLKQLLGIVVSSIYLTAAVAGLHPTKGYWVYSTVMILVLGVVLASTFLRSRSSQSITIIVLVLLMLPGAGLRTTTVYLYNWNNPAYHAPSFIQTVLKEYPQEGLFLSDLSYVFDIYLTGRKTILLKDRSDYANQIDLNADYIFTAWEGNDAGWADQYGPYSIRHIGNKVPDQACYVDIAVPVKEVGNER